MLSCTNEQRVCKSQLPWSIPRVLFWLFLYFLSSIVVNDLTYLLILYLNSTFRWELTITEFIQIIPIYTTWILIPGGCLFLQRKCNHAALSIRDIWGNHSLPIWNTLSAILLGCIFSFIWSDVNINFSVYLQAKHVRSINFFNHMITMGFLIPFIEELYFRGILYRVFCKHLLRWVAMVFSIIIFVLYHIQYWSNPIHFIFVFICGLITTLCAEQTRSLTIGFVFHATLNLTSIVIFQYREILLR